MINMEIPNAESVSKIAVAASAWLPRHIATLESETLQTAPIIFAANVHPVLPGFDLWDLWPLQCEDGSVAEIAAGSLWMVLSAPSLSDPGERHDIARTRLMHRIGDDWIDCGTLFPDALNPGSREWSGSALFDPENNKVTAFFTAAGHKSDIHRSFEQRLFQTTGTLDLSKKHPRILGWSDPLQSVVNDGFHYVDVALDQGIPGLIRGFRDPYWFRDPASKKPYLLFTGSLAGSASKYNGVVGLAAAQGEDGQGRFELLPPIISANGLANEMERPHVIVRDGLYYLFWSTQNSVFAPDGPVGPTGLYGMVAPSIYGPFEPLNGSGLVLCNPVEEPKQAYCWQVLDTLEVVSFIDHWGLQGRDAASDPVLNRAQFGGTVAPMLKIAIEGNTTRLLGLA